jgi:hypothetical protein
VEQTAAAAPTAAVDQTAAAEPTATSDQASMQQQAAQLEWRIRQHQERASEGLTLLACPKIDCGTGAAVAVLLWEVLMDSANNFVGIQCPICGTRIQIIPPLPPWRSAPSS